MKLEELREVLARGEGVPDPEPEPPKRLVLGIDHGAEKSVGVLAHHGPDGVVTVIDTLESPRSFGVSEAEVEEHLKGMARTTMMGTPYGESVLETFVDGLGGRSGSVRMPPEHHRCRSTIHGARADTIIVDDPLTDSKATPGSRDALKKWFDASPHAPPPEELYRIAEAVGVGVDSVLEAFRRLGEALKPATDTLKDVLERLSEVTPRISVHDLRRTKLRSESKIWRGDGSEVRERLREAIGSQFLWKLWYRTRDLSVASRRPIKPGDVVILGIKVFNARDHPKHEFPGLVERASDQIVELIGTKFIKAALVVDIEPSPAHDESALVISPIEDESLVGSRFSHIFHQSNFITT